MFLICKDIPCPILLKEEPDTFLILFKDEQKWIFKCSLGYGEIEKDEDGKYHLFNGKYHREGGPAIEYFDGKKQWFKNGERHRLDGPAVQWGNMKEWFIEDLEYSEEEYFKKIEEMKLDGTYSL